MSERSSSVAQRETEEPRLVRLGEIIGALEDELVKKMQAKLGLTADQARRRVRDIAFPAGYQQAQVVVEGM